jgi:hypothetical protein
LTDLINCFAVSAARVPAGFQFTRSNAGSKERLIDSLDCHRGPLDQAQSTNQALPFSLHPSRNY